MFGVNNDLRNYCCCAIFEAFVDEYIANSTVFGNEKRIFRLSSTIGCSRNKLNRRYNVQRFDVDTSLPRNKNVAGTIF